MTTIRLSPAERPLGRSTLRVSPLAWGMWRMAGEDTRPVRALVDAALEAGITLFDTADVYGRDEGGFGSTEALLGSTLAETPGLRDRMVIATKGGITPPVPYDSSADYLERAVDASLRRLRIDTIDLYQIHRRDLLTHPQEVAGALSRMVDAGKVRALGVSNHSPDEFDALQRFLGHPLASTQPEFSPLHARPLFDGTLDRAMAGDVAVLAWSPLAGGRLLRHPAGALLEEIGADFGVDGTAAALSWIIAHPTGIIPIVGSQTPARVRASADAYKVEWSRERWYAVLQRGMGEKLP